MAFNQTTCGTQRPYPMRGSRSAMFANPYLLGRTLLGVLPLDTTGTSTSEGRLEAEVNVLLRVEPDDEGRDVDNLFPHPNVPLSDQNSGVMNRLGQPQLENLSLQPTLQKVLNLQTQ